MSALKLKAEYGLLLILTHLTHTHTHTHTDLCLCVNASICCSSCRPNSTVCHFSFSQRSRLRRGSQESSWEFSCGLSAETLRLFDSWRLCLELFAGRDQQPCWWTSSDCRNCVCAGQILNYLMFGVLNASCCCSATCRWRTVTFIWAAQFVFIWGHKSRNPVNWQQRNESGRRIKTFKPETTQRVKQTAPCSHHHCDRLLKLLVGCEF